MPTIGPTPAKQVHRTATSTEALALGHTFCECGTFNVPNASRWAVPFSLELTRDEAAVYSLRLARDHHAAG
jgi:hypothetical protein